MLRENGSYHEKIPYPDSKWEEMSPQAVLRWALAQFGSRLTLGTGLGPSGIVLAHMLREITPEPDVFFLDTGLHFDETITLLAQLEDRLSIRIRRLRPSLDVYEQAAQYGPSLWGRDPNLCCMLRKVIPLRAHLANFDAWITGIRRDQGATRANAPVVHYAPAYSVVKLNPLATWTKEMVWAYIQAHELPYNELHLEGYPSIGCMPCTQPVTPGRSERAGRWVGFAKVECGIHTC